MEETPMEMRVPGDADGDYVMLQWWAQLIADGELGDVFDERAAASPSGFLSLFGPATIVFFTRDEQGAAIVIWFEPFMGNVAMGMWARRDWRHRKWWGHLVWALRQVFTQYPMVLFMTKRPHVVESGDAMGFVNMGKMPYLYRGEDGFIAYTTREAFERKHG